MMILGLYLYEFESIDSFVFTREFITFLICCNFDTNGFYYVAFDCLESHGFNFYTFDSSCIKKQKLSLFNFADYFKEYKFDTVMNSNSLYC